MYFKYGAYQHLDNEAKLVTYIVRPINSPRGRKALMRYEMHIQIEVVLPTGTIYTTTTAQQYLDQLIIEIINAYANNFQDATFYHDDGTPTRHVLDNATSISGVRIINRSWPRGDALNTPRPARATSLSRPSTSINTPVSGRTRKPSKTSATADPAGGCRSWCPAIPTQCPWPRKPPSG